MRLRLILINKQLYLLCTNGSKMLATKDVIKRLLKEFKHPSRFKGDEYWNCVDMECVEGRTIAYVDEKYNLVILDNLIFDEILNSDELVSASEYAELNGKKVAIVKRKCAENRIPGAYKTSSGWLIPKNAPYPARKPRIISPKNN